jgi:hypothetical protein
MGDMACADVATTKAKIMATNLVIFSSVANICEAPALGWTGLLGSVALIGEAYVWVLGVRGAYPPVA